MKRRNRSSARSQKSKRRFSETAMKSNKRNRRSSPVRGGYRI